MASASPHQRTRRLPRPRWAWLAALCVALGFMTSVGVAWGIAWSIPETKIVEDDRGYLSTISPALTFQGSHASWLIERYTIEHAPGVTGTSFIPMLDSIIESNHWKSAPGVGVILAEPSIRDAVALHTKLLHTPQFQVVSFVVYQIGWPVRCCSFLNACTAEDANSLRRGLKDPLARTGTLDPAFDLEAYYDAFLIGKRPLPLRPIWPGLLADTSIYAGAWAFVILTPLGIRQWLRARRGACPQCGYSREGLKVDAVCPECGRVVT